LEIPNPINMAFDQILLHSLPESFTRLRGAAIVEIVVEVTLSL